MASIPPSPISPDALDAARAGRWALGTVIGAVAAVAAVGWAYLVAMAWGMEHMSVAGDWWLMPRMSGWRATGAAALGYLTAWAGFSVLATLAQWALLELRLVTPMMDSASAALSGLLLAGAGLYQFTALKQVCLTGCRSPIGALMAASGASARSAFLMGLRQGSYCVGCCGLLMALLFVLGVMNLWWVVVLTLVVLVEKLMREPRWFVRLVGAALLVWAAMVAVPVLR